MPEQSQSNNNQMMVYALIAIAVLLAAIVGFMIYDQTANKVPSPTVSGTGTSATSATTGSSTAGATTPQMPPASTAGPFDPKTATKIPVGMTPAAALKTYNEDILAGKFADAYKLLPLDKQQSYGSASAYEQQVKAYGITSYKVGTPTTQGSDTVITAEQVTPQMPITYTWTYTKVGDTWYVKSRVMGGTVQ
jgi:hypothetical protein